MVDKYLFAFMLSTLVCSTHWWDFWAIWWFCSWPFHYMPVSVLPTSAFVPCVFSDDQKRALDPTQLESDSCELSCGCWKPRSSARAASDLNFKLSLQSLCLVFWGPTKLSFTDWTITHYLCPSTRFHFFHIFTNTSSFLFLWYMPQWACGEISHCIRDWHLVDLIEQFSGLRIMGRMTWSLLYFFCT